MENKTNSNTENSQNQLQTEPNGTNLTAASNTQDSTSDQSITGTHPYESLDAGGIRTAAFDEGGEPRSQESTGANRGITQGSNDDPK